MRSFFSLLIVLFIVIALSAGFAGSMEKRHTAGGNEREIPRVIVIDGSGVHDIGELHLHTGNWGIFGSYPSSSMPVAQFPSAEWPAGSGVEHLYIAGLWIGARKGGFPSVSTSAFERELMPTDDPIDIIYNSYEGAPGGARLPSPMLDDDGDGMIDEDFLDGRDNDGDGLVDEDFAAISPQMFSSWYTDNQPVTGEIYPEHEPLGIMVRQETYQWDSERFDDFVGVKLTVTNIGEEIIEDLYFGIFTDGDVGRRSDGVYWNDDASGWWTGTISTDLGPADLDVAYVYDYDGDGGRTTSYLGVVILDHPVDPLGISAPQNVGWLNFRQFGGDQPYENGGDPTNDFQRYEVMSTSRRDMSDGGPVDCRVYSGIGPFAQLGPGESMVVHVGLVAGDGLDGLLENAASCRLLYEGIWLDLDDDPATGIDGKETQVHWMLEAPPEGTAVLDIKPGSCRNPFNIKNFEFLGGSNRKKGGVMPVAILGGEGFDVTEINISSVRLNGVPPLRQGQRYNDVAGPGESDGPCSCPEEGSDGCEDLLLKFSNQEIAATRLILSIPVPGEQWTLTITGELDDGTSFQASDCVTFVGPPPGNGKPDRPYAITGGTRLLGASPNPFNPSTTISFELAGPVQATLAVYDVRGRLVNVLLSRQLPAGLHEVTWDGRSRSSSMSASGIYYFRLIAGDFVETRKMVLLR
jgi:hypothetical protein